MAINTNLSAAVAIGPKKGSVFLDIYIQDGSPSSFQVEHDESVSRPSLSGPTHTDGLAQDIQYDISNLDPDVVDVFLGENAFGINDIHSFQNNGDGTGSISVDFDPLVVPRRLSIFAKDDVDNESDESLSVVVFALDHKTLNAELTIVPQKMVWTDTCNDLIDRIPITEFIHRGQFNVPYSFNSTAFELRAIVPGIPVHITIVREGEKGDDEEQKTIVPTGDIHLVKLQLGSGLNTVYATDGEEETQIRVVATHYAAIECSYAREIFNFSKNLVEEQERAVASPTSTRLAEPYIPFTKDLPDIRSLQTLAMKLGVKTLTNETKSHKGVRDYIASLTLSTPVFSEQENEQENFDPSIYPLVSAPEDFGGVEAHAWIQNPCVSTWMTFMKYIDNIDAFRIVSVNESEIVFEDDKGEVVSHRFDFENPDCSLASLIEQEFCFDDITISVAMVGEMKIIICAAQYPFDLQADEDGALPFEPLDDEAGEEGLDPGFDGLDGFSVTGRFDSDTELDSYGPQPASSSDLDDCVFESYIVRPHTLASANVDDNRLYFNITADGLYESQRPASTMMDVLVAATKTAEPDVDLAVADAFTRNANIDNLVADQKTRDTRLNVQVAETQSRLALLGVMVQGREAMSASLDVNIEDS